MEGLIQIDSLKELYSEISSDNPQIKMIIGCLADGLLTPRVNDEHKIREVVVSNILSPELNWQEASCGDEVITNYDWEQNSLTFLRYTRRALWELDLASPEFVLGVHRAIFKDASVQIKVGQSQSSAEYIPQAKSIVSIGTEGIEHAAEDLEEMASITGIEMSHEEAVEFAHLSHTSHEYIHMVLYWAYFQGFDLDQARVRQLGFVEKRTGNFGLEDWSRVNLELLVRGMSDLVLDKYIASKKGAEYSAKLAQTRQERESYIATGMQKITDALDRLDVTTGAYNAACRTVENTMQELVRDAYLGDPTASAILARMNEENAHKTGRFARLIELQNQPSLDRHEVARAIDSADLVFNIDELLMYSVQPFTKDEIIQVLQSSNIHNKEDIGISEEDAA